MDNIIVFFNNIQSAVTLIWKKGIMCFWKWLDESFEMLNKQNWIDLTFRYLRKLNFYKRKQCIKIKVLLVENDE